MSIHWYVVHVHSGYEHQVKRSLLERIKRFGMQDKFGKVMVPVEEVIEVREGQKRRSERKFFPGYLLVEMQMNDDTWHLVKHCPKVLSFIGGSSEKPTPIKDEVVQNVMQQMQDGVDQPKPKVIFEPGEVVRVTEGPFNDFNGVVEEVNYEKSRMLVAVQIFGRSTPVELEFGQVEKG